MKMRLQQSAIITFLFALFTLPVLARQGGSVGIFTAYTDVGGPVVCTYIA